ncbi:MAG: ShlB/FhaC/HecB family hemolysin secretion/activation protein [Candidatus Kaelpia imicola]|nr:ShlB/FhaC/HecB family hemolysin secretion/activation protein [Candidatus Kaelpia imicola]
MKFINLLIAYALILSVPVYADEAASAGDMQQILDRLDQLQGKVTQLESKVKEQDEVIKRQNQALDKLGEMVPEVKKAMAPPEPKVVVSNFVLSGVNLFDPIDFEPVLKKYRSKELGISDLKTISDELTAFYRSKGYITSLAYAPTQEIENETVEFRVIEGRVGNIELEGGEYFKKETMAKRITIEEGQVLNYERLQRDVRKLNKQPDRTMKAILLPGQDKGTTDILIKMEEESDPKHFYFDCSNTGTEETKTARFGLGFAHNNLLGYDDILSIKARVGDWDIYSISADYNVPINKYNTRIGAYGIFSHTDIGGQFTVIEPEGSATALGAYITHPLFDKDYFDPVAINLSSDVIAGLDLIDVKNMLLGEETSHDVLRVAKLGISFDERDALGRTFFNNEFRVGIDGLGSMDSNDESSSIIDAGSEFMKYTGTLTRITRLPFSMMFINNLKFQHTNNPLVTSEQLSLGGADTIRGYPQNDYLADFGYVCTLELRTPAFIFPREIKVPYDDKKTPIMDAVQFVYFVDFGKGHRKNPRVGETKDQFMIGTGFGFRFDLYEHLRARLDFGFPAGNEEPSDGSSGTVHVGVQYEF